jgi:uncharacterized protein
MIIDGHAHVHPDRDGQGPKYDARLDTLIRNLDECEVDRALIYAEAVDVPYIKRIENAYVGEVCERHPDRLIGFASVHPAEERAVETFVEAVNRWNLRGLKLHPRFQGVSAADPRVAALVEKAAELDLPVAIDALLWKPTPLTVQMPINIDTVCKAVPGARIMITHAGGLHFMDAFAVAIANPNTYLEISTSLTYFHDTPFEDQFLFVLKKLGPRRVIFGSDHPQEPLKPCFELSRSILRKHGFSEGDLGWIFGKTLLSILPGAEAV